MARKDPESTQKTRNRIDKFDNGWRVNRVQYHEWFSFVMGGQWREDESKLFERYNKIPLTMNKLWSLANYMIGDQRRNTPSIQIEPDKFVKVRTAQARSALIRNISFNSQSKISYQTGYRCAVIGGFGAAGVRTKYESNRSNNQVVDIYEIKDPTRAYWDLSAESPCKTDGMHCGLRTRMSREKFRSIYGKKIEQSIGADLRNDDNSLNFADDDCITLVTDYKRKTKSINIYTLSNERTIDQDEYDELEEIDIDGAKFLSYDGEPVTIIAQRKAEDDIIQQQLVAGEYILDETEFPSQQLPIVFIDQDSYWDKNGNQICRPFFLDVEDAQRYLNYLATQSAYILKVSRYDQFIASRANVKNADTQAIWRDPSVQQGALIYDESPNGDKPQQLTPPELSNSLMQQYERTLMDIQSGTGLYATQLGDQGNEISGKAIDKRSNRGSISTSVSKDSLDRAVTCIAQIVNEMIPNVYDSKRMMMLAIDGGNPEEITLNNPVDAYGSEIENDMTEGTYSIKLTAGASHEGQEQEALDSMQMVLNNDPTLFRLIGDLYVENLPFGNKIELRNRIRTIIPPEVIEAGKTGKPIQNKQPDPQTVMAQQEMELKKQAMKLEMERVEMEAHFKQQELDFKMRELEQKARETGAEISLDYQKLQTQKEEAAAELQETLLRFQAEVHKTNTDKEISHAQNIVKILTHHPKEHKENKSITT